ncbi:MAG TPA: hypothetical protein VFD63_05775 [Pyrinomonadaceae bacterium]|nr:hypothetical protein [Pyrinomonadaceae bacterium]
MKRKAALSGMAIIALLSIATFATPALAINQQSTAQQTKKNGRRGKADNKK